MTLIDLAIYRWLPLLVVAESGASWLLRGRAAWLLSSLWIVSPLLLLASVLHLSEHSQAALRRDETRDHLLRDILGRRAEQVLKLDGAELLDDGALLADALMEALLELVKLALFLVEVLDEAPSPLLHLT